MPTQTTLEGIRQVDYPFSQLVPTHMGMATMKDVRMTRWYLEHEYKLEREEEARTGVRDRQAAVRMDAYLAYLKEPGREEALREAFLGTPPESPDAWRASLTGLGTRSVSIRSGDEAAYAGRLGEFDRERKAGWSAAKLETAQSVAEELAETSGKLDKLEAGLTKGNPALFLQKIRDMRRSMASFISAEDGPKWAELEERALRLVRNGANVPTVVRPSIEEEKARRNEAMKSAVVALPKGDRPPLAPRGKPEAVAERNEAMKDAVVAHAAR